jgi:DNA-3-methyladenine glycosylase I
VPVHDDRTLFEFLILEGAPAGLSWSTILNKRENYRNAFDNFEPQRALNSSARRFATPSCRRLEWGTTMLQMVSAARR